MKRCPICGGKKKLSEFYRNRARHDGRDCYCRECRKKVRKGYWKSGNYKETKRRYRQTEAGRESERRSDSNEKGKARHRRYLQSEHGRRVNRAYQRSIPKKIRGARVAVREAVAKAHLVRPDACARCGKECKPEGHHYIGYEPENWLDVEWLCKACHVGAHA